MARTIRTNDLSSAIDQMNVTHLHCRDYGHSWQPFAVEILPKNQGYAQELVCSRCDTHRIRFLDRFGDIASHPIYHWPDGYRMVGLGRLTAEDRCQIRLASVRDLLKR